jgi:hypothetical protein
MNALINGMASHSRLGHYLELAMGSYASRPSESQTRAMRGSVTGMADALSTAGMHEHRQHTDATP